MLNRRDTYTIAVGSTTTNSITLNEYSLAAITTTGSVLTATTLSLLVSHDGTNFYPLYDRTSEVTISASGVARSYAIEPTLTYPFQFVKIREGTSASAVAQATYPVSFVVDYAHL
jgi:hypothetical protein